MRCLPAPYTPGVEQEESPRYPWQLELPPRTPAAKLSETERGRCCCQTLFEIERAILEAGVGDEGPLVHDP